MAEEKRESTAPDQRTTEQREFGVLLKKEFKPKSDRAREAVEDAVRILAEHATSETTLVSDDTIETIEAMIAELDRKLSEQINAILHHPDFQQLEGAWRGLHYLVSNTETDEMLKIRVMNVSKKDVAKVLKKYKGTAWDQSPLFKKIYGEEYGMLGGQPYGCLVGDYFFDHSPADVEMLGGMAQIAGACFAPFITGADPRLMNMDTWQELSDPRDLTKIFATPEYAAWRSLRDSEDSKFLGLAMPRYLSRLPYGAKGEPVEEFAFEEVTEGGDHSKFTWANSAYPMAVNINRAFKNYGWCSRIRGVESGGAVEGLPTHTFPTDDGGVDMKCPTEIGIEDRREGELAKNGFMPLLHRKNSDTAVFIGAQSLHKPPVFDDAEATANAALGARLPYLFATCRFAHYLKCMVRDKVGVNTSRENLQKFLQNWIMQYVDGDPVNSGPEIKARKPLAKAMVTVEENAEDPGYYKSVFHLLPHYQLEGLTVSLRLVSKLPAAAKA